MSHSGSRLLITAIGFGATWQSNAERTPWSVYVTKNGRAVLGGGGKYPDDDPNAQLLIANLPMDDAIALSEGLESVLTDLGVSCNVEVLADA